jgi:hypothetical protein
MTLMLRSLGIPARVVSGYRGGEWSALDQAYLIRANMAHLWVEVYFLGVGWVTFDPSPGEPGLILTSNPLMRMISRYGLRAKMIWYSEVVGFNQGIQFDVLKRAGVGFVGLGANLFDQATGGRGQGGRALSVLPGAVSIVALLGVLSLVLVGRRSSWGRIGPLTADQKRAVRLYRSLRRVLERAGVVCRGRTAEEIVGAAERLGVGVVGPAATIVQLYNEVRFGERPLNREQFRDMATLLRRAGAKKVLEAPPATSSPRRPWP